MSREGFAEFAKRIHSVRGSGTAYSYITAIRILDEIFAIEDIFELNGVSLTEIKDPELADDILNFVKIEERRFRYGENSIFRHVRINQTSYPKKNFCSSAMNCLTKYISHQITQQVPHILQSSIDRNSLIKSLNKLIGIKSTQTVSQVQQRIGQDVFREVILNIYGSKCCLTRLEVPETLRASHIIAWADDKNNRLNPENGLCLSATYDAAFDKHLISFDEDYRLILSPNIKELYTSKVFNEYFRKKEGLHIIMPSSYSPNQTFLQKHREKLVL